MFGLFTHLAILDLNLGAALFENSKKKVLTKQSRLPSNSWKPRAEYEVLQGTRYSSYFLLQAIANAMKVSQTSIYKSVNTWLFLRSLVATSFVKFNIPHACNRFLIQNDF